MLQNQWETVTENENGAAFTSRETAIIRNSGLYFLSELSISNTGYIVSSLQKQGKKNNISN